MGLWVAHGSGWGITSVETPFIPLIPSLISFLSSPLYSSSTYYIYIYIPFNFLFSYFLSNTNTLHFIYVSHQYLCSMYHMLLSSSSLFYFVSNNNILPHLTPLSMTPQFPSSRNVLHLYILLNLRFVILTVLIIALINNKYVICNMLLIVSSYIILTDEPVYLNKHKLDYLICDE